MSAEAKIRLEARTRLGNGNWSKAVAITVTVLAVAIVYILCDECASSILNVQDAALNNFFSNPADFTGAWNLQVYGAVAVLTTLLFILVAVPLHLGLTRWNYFAAQGKSPSAGEIFYYLSSGRLYVRSLRYTGLMAARILFWGAVCFLPDFIVMLVLNSIKGIPAAQAWGAAAEIILTVAGAAAFVAVMLNYFAAKYALVAFEGTDVPDCFRISRRRMHGRKRSVLWLAVTFAPWLLSCFFVLPVLFALPYLHCSFATCGKWIISDEKKTA